MKSPTRIVAVLGGVVLVVGLAGCADGGTASPEETTDVSASTAPASTAAEAPSPNDSAAVVAEHNAADVTFAQMMIVHHEGALEMAELAAQKADSGENKTLAAQIEAAQLPEIELMESWLTAWGEPREPAGHTGMDHNGMDMNGMSQEQVMDEIQQLTGPEFDNQFLTAMIAHHEGAVLMSEEELEEGQNPGALDLAKQIIEAQEAEIQQMQQHLENL